MSDAVWHDLLSVFNSIMLALIAAGVTIKLARDKKTATAVQEATVKVAAKVEEVAQKADEVKHVLAQTTATVSAKVAEVRTTLAADLEDRVRLLEVRKNGLTPPRCEVRAA